LRSDKAVGAAAGRPLEPRDHPGMLRVQVPEDIVAIRRDDAAAALRWRMQVREALGGAMSRGYHVDGFTRAFEYVLSPD
jgi:predicted GNAT superfamily acetyltransferase